MMSNLCTPWGALPPKKFGGAKFFPNLLGSGGAGQTFPGNSPLKGVPKLVLKFWGLPPKKKFEGGQSLEISILKLALLRGRGSHALHIFTSGSGS